MRHLILIRHAAVSTDATIPSHEWPLSANGRQACQKLAPLIAPYQPAHIITSTEPKASQTGQIIADYLQTPCHTAVNLHEHDRRGQPYFPRQADFQAAVANFFNQPDKLVLGRETAVQARQRFTQAVHTVLAQYPTGNIAIVAHGTVITLFLCHHNPQFLPLPLWQSLSLPCFFIVALPHLTYISGPLT